MFRIKIAYTNIQLSQTYKSEIKYIKRYFNTLITYILLSNLDFETDVKHAN
jgi:hypothetical protein